MEKTLLFLGDSITEGVGASTLENRYVSKVETMTGTKCYNYGVGGTRLARQEPGLSPWTIWDYDFIARTMFMPKKADFVFVFGGTNDYGHGFAPLGQIGDCCVDTYCGAIQYLINILSETYGKDKLCFILPLHRYGEENTRGDGWKVERGPLSVYIDLQKQILIKNNISFMDLANEFPTPTTNLNSDLFADGLHPNDKGHQLLADKVVEYLKDNHII